MNHRQLEAFYITMKLGSVTSAARALHISQPSVSRLINELEQSTGIRLFHHQKGKLNPTREAELFFEEVDRSFVGLKSLRKAVDRIKDLSLGRLRLGFPPALSVKVLPDAVRRFTEKHGKTNISVWVRSSRRISEWISAYQLDVGIVISDSERPSISILDKVKTKFVAVLPSNHPLAERDCLGWKDLEKENLISIERDYLLGRTMDPKLIRIIEKQVRFETEICFTACTLVQQGLGIALVDPFTASHFLDLGLVAKQISMEIPYEFYVIHAKHRKPSLAVESFLPILRQTIGSICPQD